ncbi:hypothetical protein F5Y17DRAFT_135913 [Xylariaceae sp. FL0594]|nr:hypothetical protein F5Y17DRAFT_135913 [Xylariaceae sp. FL0594]
MHAQYRLSKSVRATRSIWCASLPVAGPQQSASTPRDAQSPEKGRSYWTPHPITRGGPTDFLHTPGTTTSWGFPFADYARPIPPQQSVRGTRSFWRACYGWGPTTHLGTPKVPRSRLYQHRRGLACPTWILERLTSCIRSCSSLRYYHLSVIVAAEPLKDRYERCGRPAHGPGALGQILPQ